ncbi:MAG: sigma-70 family RNA polymerase sigma factor [Actinomycetota bacterium]|nr:sigma-70 family RNA polymerase sigma factor [Actinomycetota bacterium]
MLFGRSIRDEDELVKLAMVGDDAATGDLIQIHQQKMYNLALRMSKNPHDASDLTQDIFIQMMKKMDTFRFESSFSTWLYRLAVNLCLDFLRRRARRWDISIEEGPDRIACPSSFSENPTSRIEERELKADIERAIRGLKPKYRLIIILCDIDGLSYAQAAEAMKVPVGTVKSRLARARLKLAAELKGASGTIKRT